MRALNASSYLTYRRCAIAGTILLAHVGCRAESESEATRSPSGNAGDRSGAEVSDSRTLASRATPKPAERPTEPVDPRSCLTGECHQNLVRRSYVHPPVEAVACELCHLPEQPVHKFPIRETGPQLCTTCHDVAERKPYQHAVVVREGCLPCHDPHASNAKFLVTDMSPEMLCQRCHQVERKRYLHSGFASGACTLCHEPHGGTHRAFLIGGEGKEHCLSCHTQRRERLATSTHIHKPIRETGCTDCHTHHSSEYEHILVKDLYDLCMGCHPQIEGAITGAASPHGAVFTGEHCANCHESHEGDRPYLLREKEQVLCLECHNRPQLASNGDTIPDMTPVLVDARFLHGPIRAGNCSACHYTHASRYAMLLRKYFPRDFYEAFHLEDYALCFTCHSESTVLEGESPSFTGFRNGSTNLHYVHVNRQDKGRTCRTCHEIHGSNLTRHMASTVPFEGGGWAMPIRMQQTETGGRCSPGCHEPREYRRSPQQPGGAVILAPENENAEAGQP